MEHAKGHKKFCAPEWNIEVVIATLAKAPFEPNVDISLKHLTIKTDGRALSVAQYLFGVDRYTPLIQT